MKRRHLQVASVVLMVLLVTLRPAQADVWADALDPVSGARYIPLELWHGGPWDGNRTLTLAGADLSFGDGTKRITGPEVWVDPVSGKRHHVYERVNKNKVQLFAVRADGSGLGRVHDSRSQRICEPGFKFPLGIWHEGESRTIQLECWKSSGAAFTRKMTISIEKLDFVFRGQAHSLRYRWIADGGDKRGLDVSYTYSPGLGNVQLEYN